MITCKICNKQFNSQKELNLHIKQYHKITLENYYERYISNSNSNNQSIKEIDEYITDYLLGKVICFDYSINIDEYTKSHNYWRRHPFMKVRQIFMNIFYSIKNKICLHQVDELTTLDDIDAYKELNKTLESRHKIHCYNILNDLSKNALILFTLIDNNGFTLDDVYTYMDYYGWLDKDITMYLQELLDCRLILIDNEDNLCIVNGKLLQIGAWNTP